MTLSGVCGFLLISSLDAFEHNRTLFFPIIFSLIIIYTTYAGMMLFFIYLETTGETLVHLLTHTCRNGENCRFRHRYRDQIFERKFGKILSKEKSQKTAAQYIRISDTRLALKSSVKDQENGQKPTPNHQGNLSESKCFICTENPLGFAYLPCMHTGVCARCGLDTLLPKNQQYSGRELKCPLCRKTPKSVFFYKEKVKEDQGGGEVRELVGLGIKDLKSHLGMTDKEFDSIFHA